MVRVDVSRVWVGRITAALVAAFVVNLSLTVLEVEHDSQLIALLAATTVATGVLALAAIDAHLRPSWKAPREERRPHSGEDTRTTMYRHLIEAHEASRDADDAVLWQIADLATRRLRQVHGLRYADDPQRAEELLGPHLAELVSRDRRHRYQPDQHHQRYSVDQLGELVRRIEEL
jgi:hypothetical protein